MRLGFHMPVAGGLLQALERSRSLGLGCLQIFSGNPRAWAQRPLEPALGRDFAHKADRADIAPVVVHAPYLLNLASPLPDNWERAVAGLIDQLARARTLGAAAVVVHPGSSGQGERARGLARVAQAVRWALDAAGQGTACWLENTCGGGGQVGASLEELAVLLEMLPGLAVGVCLDTAHAWAAGYNLHGRPGVRRFLDQVERTLGLEQVKLWHFNDSRHSRGSRRDEHLHLGQGLLGRAGMRALAQEPRLQRAAVILETPADPPGRAQDLALLRTWLEAARPPDP